MSCSEMHDCFAIFFHNILWLRKHNGLSKKRMAEILGIGQWSLNKLEKGEIPPRMDINIVFALSRQFGIPPFRLFGEYLE